MPSAESAEAFYGAARIMYRSMEFPGALGLLDKAVSGGHNSAKFYELRGRVRFEMGDLKRARKDFDEALKRDPSLEAVISNYKNRMSSGKK